MGLGDISAGGQPTALGHIVAFTTVHLRSILIAYGIVFASFGLVRLEHDIHGAEAGLSPYRLTQLASSIDLVDRHGPPLTGAGQSPASFYPIAVDDDRGGFVYVPLAAHFLKTRDIGELLKWTFILFFVPLLVAYPLVLYEITRSVVAAIAAPPILLGHFAFLETSGFFWMPAWANLVLLPILLLVNKHWRQSRFWLLIPLALIASFASSVRANAGLGFMIGALVLIILRVKGWGMRLPMIALLLLAYLSISSFAMRAIQLQRDEVVGHDFTSPYPNGHPLWHNVYLGLGYLKNPYGIRIKDPIAAAAARREDPAAAFPTKRYESALRRVYFKTLEHHPTFVAREYLIKAGVVFGSAVKWFPFVIVLTPIFLLLGRPRERRRRGVELMLLAGAGLVGASTGVLVNPERVAENQSAWYSFLLLLWLMVLGWFARPIEEVTFTALHRAAKRTARVALVVGWRNVGRVFFARDTTWWRLRPNVGGRLAWSSIGSSRFRGRNRFFRLALVVLIPSAIFLAEASTNSSYAAASYWNAEGPLLAQGYGRVIADWNVESHLPSDWVVSANSVKRKQHQLILETNSDRYGYEINSAPRTLRPGRYLLEVSGRVLKGSLRVGVVDDRTGTFIASNIYWSGQRFRGRHMAVPFELAKDAPVRILFTNFKVNDENGLWSLSTIQLRQLDGGCRLFDPAASFGPLGGGPT